jgi:hypothetical protein
MNYAEDLAQRLFDANSQLDATGRAGAVIDAAWPWLILE